MIETEQSVEIDAAIGGVWDYVRDIRRWANLMPGLQDCAIIDENDSRWTLKVAVGGLVRTVKVLVHVDRWDGPGRVEFSYQLEGDPVSGGGTYVAVAKDGQATEIALTVRVEGSGSMAPMWEAMGRPLLPQFAKAFANQLKTEIEKAVTAPAPADQAAPAPADQIASAPFSPFAAIGQWLRGLWRDVWRRKTGASARS